ncbi:MULTISPECIES: hypothetical protein [unclassified Alcanivorax]|uniref:hypothetical protein n=1 Tax=unclassified Alcanivorax TaxID=2638842 RepID=UPI000789E44E|nr:MULTISPECIES: hypothetical protein [unclassified Alcanivorax]MEE2604340.1 hypothetical protein [Pseudomonadota bacterium]MEE3387147.1 hypothetical protein [Pseudomonadota bacterium]
MKSLLAMLSFLILLSACQSRGINDEYAVALQECLEGDLIVRDISYKEKHYSSLAINKNCLYQEEVTGTSMFSGNGDFPVMVFCPGQALPCQEYGALFVRYQFPRRDEITHGLQMSAMKGEYLRDIGPFSFYKKGRRIYFFSRKGKLFHGSCSESEPGWSLCHIEANAGKSVSYRLTYPGRFQDYDWQALMASLDQFVAQSIRVAKFKATQEKIDNEKE